MTGTGLSSGRFSTTVEVEETGFIFTQYRYTFTVAWTDPAYAGLNGTTYQVSNCSN